MIDLSEFHKKMAQTPWLAIGAPIGTLGTQIDKPASTLCFVIAAFATIIYGIYHVAERHDPDEKSN